MSEKINNDFFLLDSGYSNYEGNTDLPRHRWYYYKEGFSPNLVEKAIEKVGVDRNDYIIDPFNGSGTTTLTASLNGHKSIGIEVNPFTSFLADVKNKNADLSELTNMENKLIEASAKKQSSPLLGYSTFSKRDKLDKWLFNDSVLNSFESGWHKAESIPSYNVRKLAKLSLIASAMKNCNATRDGKCLRYRENWKKNKYNKDSFIESLKIILSNIKADIEEKPIQVQSKIINGDCRKALKNLNHIPAFKLCITSPPYLNTFDYTDIYRPELFLGKFAESNKHLRKLRLETVRSHIQVKWQKPILNDFGVLYTETMKHINGNIKNLMSKNIPIMIQAYFEDMFNILKLLKLKALPDAQVWFVISNSAYADYEVPVDLIIGDIASKAGWYLKEIGVLRYISKRKTKYSKSINQLRESVIMLSNNKDVNQRR